MTEPDDNTKTSRELNAGAGQAYSMAFELVMTPAIFAVLGWLLDRAIGVSPLFVIIFPVIVFVYELWKIWRQYNARMEELESNIPTRRRRPAGG